MKQYKEKKIQLGLYYVQQHKLTLKSPGCCCDWISPLCFLLEEMEGNRLLPLGLLEEVKSLLEYLCFDASERGEMGDRSIFSFLFIGIAKLEMEITAMECHKDSFEKGKCFMYYQFNKLKTCW